MHPALRRLAPRWYSRFSGSSITVQGEQNVVELADSVRRHGHLRITGNGNRVAFAPQCRLWDLHLELVGNHHRLIVGSGCAIRGGNRLLEDEGSRITIGAGTTMIADALVASEGRAITLGDDCMLGAGVDIRCSDGHSILDSARSERLNVAADVSIGAHVWIAAAARVLKGVTIGGNTVVAAGAIVTRDLPAGCVAAGIPARVVREGVTWSRERLAGGVPA